MASDHATATLTDMLRVCRALAPDSVPELDARLVLGSLMRLTTWPLYVVMAQLVWDTLGKAAPLSDALDVLEEQGMLKPRLESVMATGPYDMVCSIRRASPAFAMLTPGQLIRSHLLPFAKTVSLIEREQGPVILATNRPSGVLLRTGERCDVQQTTFTYGINRAWLLVTSKNSWRFPGGPAPFDCKIDVG